MNPEIPPEEELLREIRLTRFMLGEIARGLGERMEKLEKAVEEKVVPLKPEEIEAIRRTAKEVEKAASKIWEVIETYETSLALGRPYWEVKMLIEEAKAFEERIKRKELVLIERWASKLNIYETYHEVASCQVISRVIPRILKR